MPAAELNAYSFMPNQSAKGAVPNTIASAATIAPTQLHTFVTGTVQVATITPPLQGQHILFLTFTNAAPGTFLTSGNILTAVVPTQNIPCMLLYDPVQAKYYAWANNLT